MACNIFWTYINLYVIVPASKSNSLSNKYHKLLILKYTTLRGSVNQDINVSRNISSQTKKLLHSGTIACLLVFRLVFLLTFTSWLVYELYSRPPDIQTILFSRDNLIAYISLRSVDIIKFGCKQKYFLTRPDLTCWSEKINTYLLN